MDQATREGRPAMSAGAERGEHKSPAELRADIEETRQELGDTVEALAAKTDVKARANDRIASAKETAQEKTDEFVSRVRGVTPDSAGAGAGQVVSAVENHPIPFSVLAAFAAGGLLGWTLGRR